MKVVMDDADPNVHAAVAEIVIPRDSQLLEDAFGSLGKGAGKLLYSKTVVRLGGDEVASFYSPHEPRIPSPVGGKAQTQNA
jgi:hypothetical protein